MIGGFLRLVLILMLVAGAFFVFGYWTNGAFRNAPAGADFRTPQIDTAAARERGAEIGERAARVAARVGETFEESRLTGKIKAKMVLDDLVKARNIDVTTTGSTVTVSGTVATEKEHERAVALASETQGVTRVVDHVTVAPAN